VVTPVQRRGRSPCLVPRHYPALAAEMAAGLELLRITSRTASVVAIGPGSLIGLRAARRSVIISLAKF
jgi:hypothetical protein